MSVVIETTIGDITVDLCTDERPIACLNFLKLCKLKYYNFNLFHTVERNFIAQTGDPTGVGDGGTSIWGLVEGAHRRLFEAEDLPKIYHSSAGLLSLVSAGNNLVGSQFFFTLGENLTSLDGKHCVIGEVVEGHDVLRKLNEAIVDDKFRPYQDIRITHTVILEDPYPDPRGFQVPSRSPSPSAERLMNGRIAADEDINDTDGKTMEQIQEMLAEREAKARATILEIVGDLPDAEMAPPENVLFVCKLNQVTTDDDLEIIFSRFGKVKTCEVIRDKKTGDSLQYAFVEFEDRKSCEAAYFKMDNVLIDDRRIHVDFSQSVSKVQWRGKGRGVIRSDEGRLDFNNLRDDKRRERKEERKDKNYESEQRKRVERSRSRSMTSAERRMAREERHRRADEDRKRAREERHRKHVDGKSRSSHSRSRSRSREERNRFINNRRKWNSRRWNNGGKFSYNNRRNDRRRFSRSHSRERWRRDQSRSKSRDNKQQRRRSHSRSGDSRRRRTRSRSQERRQMRHKSYSKSPEERAKYSNDQERHYRERQSPQKRKFSPSHSSERRREVQRAASSSSEYRQSKRERSVSRIHEKKQRLSNDNREQGIACRNTSIAKHMNEMPQSSSLEKRHTLEQSSGNREAEPLSRYSPNKEHNQIGRYARSRSSEEPQISSSSSFKPQIIVRERYDSLELERCPSADKKRKSSGKDKKKNKKRKTSNDKKKKKKTRRRNSSSSSSSSSESESSSSESSSSSSSSESSSDTSSSEEDRRRKKKLKKHKNKSKK